MFHGPEFEVYLTVGEMSVLKALIRNSADRWKANVPQGTKIAEISRLYEKLGGDREDVAWAWKQHEATNGGNNE